MKYSPIIFTVFLLALAVQLPACSKKPVPTSDQITTTTTMNYDSLWQIIDSLDQKQLYRSAQEEVLALSEMSKANHEQIHWIKAQIYLSKFAYHLSEDDLEAAIAGMEQSLIQGDGTERAILYSLTAELYKKYLQKYGYKIRQRTNTGEATPDDIKTWTATELINKSTDYYLKSLEDQSTQHIGIHEYDALLTEYNTATLRTTLYDILAHRAIDYFNENLWSLTDFSAQNVLTDVAFLLPYEKFVDVEIHIEDDQSIKSRALQIMQNLVRLHIQDANPDALVHADLKRLEFVYQNLRNESRGALYLSALQSLFDTYSGFDCSAEIAFYIASWYERHSSQFAQGNEDARDDLKTAAEICSAAIADFPDSYGAVQCGNLLARLKNHELSLQTERVWIPGEYHLLNINYKNVTRAFVRVIPVDPNDAIKFTQLRSEGQGYLTSLEPLREFAVDLQGTEDLRGHSTEYGLEPLPTGAYVLLISDDDSFSTSSQLAYTMMSVSQIAFWQEQQPNGSLSDTVKVPEGAQSAQYSRFVVVDRKTGAPIPGALVEIYAMIYERNNRRQELVYLSQGTTDTNGVVDNLNTKDNSRLIPKITVGEDVLFLPGNYNAQIKYKSSPGRDNAFLFTDRAIYRPGQTVHFKGYLLHFNQDNIPSVKTGQNVTLTFRNVNGKTVDTLQLKTNAYGTFSGTFRAPASGLTGRMTIMCESLGRIAIQVEEYKRPQFEIILDPPLHAAKLGDTVAVPGKAMMFSGVPVSDGDVTYTVFRQVYFPYRDWHAGSYLRFPGIERKVISSGMTKSDASGKFIIEFPTELLPGLPTHYNPEYQYVIETVVTDRAGETQSGKRSVRVNTTGFVVNLDMGATIDVSDATDIPYTVSTLDGKDISATINVTAQRLETPDRFMRKRLWTSEFTQIDAATYEDQLKMYGMPSANLIENRIVEKEYDALSFQSNIDNALNLSSIFEKAGLYKLSFVVITENGESLTLERYVTCDDEAQREYANKGVVHFEANQEIYQPSEALVHRFDADIPVYLRYRIGKNKSLEAAWHDLNASLTLSSEIHEADRGGFSVQYIYVYEGRFVSKNVNVNVPWTNKKLNIDFLSYRDVTQPGANEEWRIKISGSKKDPVMAEMLATMYDASLDVFKPNDWKLNLYRTNRPQLTVHQSAFGSAYSRFLHQRVISGHKNMKARKFANLNWFDFPGSYDTYMERGMVSMAAPEMENDAIEMREDMVLNKNAQADVAPPPELTEEDIEEQGPQKIRTNLDETVFFIPHALTDEEGNIILRFKMNEALTRWKFMSIFHTADLQYALAEKEVVTQKELMVMPHVPRFLRQKDVVNLSTRVFNNSENTIRGSVTLKLFNAISGKSLRSIIPTGNQTEDLLIDPDSTKIFRWQVAVPSDLIAPVRYQFVASGVTVSNANNKSGDQEFVTAEAVGDGEEGVLPVLTDRVFVTETKVLFTPSESTRTFDFNALSSDRSASFEPFKLTLEYTSNPAWYAVQALPYLQEYPHQCVEQQFNRMYANALGGHIVSQFPEIRRVFDQWKKQDPSGLMSNLSRNQELKSILLEESPWLRTAESEEEQMRNIASLFDAYKLSEETASALRSLAEAQMSNGGFPWFPGGRDNWYITQYIVEGIGRLDKLGILDDDMRQELQPIMQAAIGYIDQRLIETYQKLSDAVDREETTFEENHLSSLIGHYLYARSFFSDVMAEGGDWSRIYAYYTQQAAKYWTEQALYTQALIATALYRNGTYTAEVATIKQSFEERSLYEEDRGRFWKSGSGWYWYEAPIERQATMIEFFAEVNLASATSADQKFIDELRQYLLMHKQTNRWSTTKSTSAAIYALLLQGDNWLEGEQVVITSGNKQIDFDDPTAGSLYTKKTWTGDAINAFDSDLTVSNTNEHVSWGGIYLQYFEDLDDIKSDAGEQLQVKKTLYTANMKDGQRQLRVVENDTKLQLGDELIVRIEIRSDRDLEFVHLKDMRASALEPVNVISHYKYQDGLGYYESTRDVATHFFFDRMPRGTYVFEYPLRVSHAGTFSNGIATLQCMYAPEFAAHSASQTLEVIDSSN